MADDRCDLLCLDLPEAERLRAARLPAETSADLAECANALGDPTRLMLAVALADGEELCVCDLAWIAERAQNLVSHHLRAQDHGLAQSRREGKMVMHSLGQAVQPRGEADACEREDVMPPARGRGRRGCVRALIPGT